MLAASLACANAPNTGVLKFFTLHYTLQKYTIQLPEKNILKSLIML